VKLVQRNVMQTTSFEKMSLVQFKNETLTSKIAFA
jgi:hypothetical protein